MVEPGLMTASRGIGSARLAVSALFLANGFTAGEYPGLGNRSIADDGWKSTITLTALP